MPTVKAFILELCLDKASAYSFLKLLRSALLPKESAGLELSSSVDLLEAACSARRALLQEAAAVPNATASSVVDALMTERSALLELSKASGSGSTQNEDGLQESYSLSTSALETALSQSEAFRKIQRELALSDCSTSDGARRALAHAFSGECVIAVRVLCNTTTTGDVHAKRFKTLGHLNDLRPYRVDYFNHALRLDYDTGEIPLRMMRYSFATPLDDSLLNQFLQFKFDKMDWVKAPFGLQGYRQLQRGWSNPSTIHPLDYFCQPDLLTDLGEFGIKLFSALGCTVDSTTQGYDFRQLCQFFAKHLNFAKRLSSLDKQYDWIQQSAEHFIASLALIGSTLRQRITSSNPAEMRLTRKLITSSAEPIAVCLRQQQNLEKVTDLSTAMEFFQPNQALASASEHLPLLSQRYSSLPKNKQPAAPRPQQAMKRPKPNTGAPQPHQGYEPGSLVSTFTFINNGNTLVISGKEWDLIKLSRYLRVGKSTVCWPYLLAECQPHNRAARCNRWGQHGHRSDDDAAHKLPGHPDGLDLRDLSNRFAVVADRRRNAPAQQRGRKGKGGPARARGRGGNPPGARGGEYWCEGDADEARAVEVGGQGNDQPAA